MNNDSESAFNMFYDESVPLLRNLPPYLVNEIKEAEDAFRSNEYYLFMTKADSVEASAKNARCLGLITEKDLRLIFKRFGWY